MDDSVGSRVRAWRRRRSGMSQQVLADLAGVTQAYISQIESGRRPLDRRSTQVAIANALNISVAQLVGLSNDRTDPLLDRAQAGVAAVRQVVVELSTGERRAPTLQHEQLVAEVAMVTGLRGSSDHATLMPLLPGLLLDLAAHGTAMAPQLMEVVDAGVYALKALGQVDLARSLVEIALPIVQDFGVPAWIGQSQYTWAQSMPPECAALGGRIAKRAAAELEHSPGADEQQVLGQLYLVSAFEAAIALQSDEAHSYLAAAEGIARALGEPGRTSVLNAGFNANWFGPTNVSLWRMAIAAELGNVGEALTVTKQVDLSRIPVPNRHVYYWTDLARALASGGKDRDAMHALARAERSAPQHFRFNPATRELVLSLIGRAKRKAVAGELFSLARTLGLDPL